MSAAYALVNGNVGTIYLPPNTPVSVLAKTNASAVQGIAITDGNSVNLSYSGSGQHNTVIGQSSVSTSSPLTVTFTYQDPTGATRNSQLSQGGPYVIGSTNMIVVVAENGDDMDFNDCVLQFSWRTPQS